MKRGRRPIDVCIISDVHLGTYGCHAKELCSYLASIKPKELILNGDIIDIWSFRKKYFPKEHMKVVRIIMKMAESGTKVVYVTGNHDEALRMYTDLQVGNFLLVDKYTFSLHGKSHWVFHGDVFDGTTKGYAKLLAKLGGQGYDLLILFNRFVNHILEFMGKERMSLSKKVKSGVKQAVKWISNFEATAGDLAIEEEFDFVICGHIHQPKIERYCNESGETTYLNSGDWIENLTALECAYGKWSLYEYKELITTPTVEDLLMQTPLEDILSSGSHLLASFNDSQHISKQSLTELLKRQNQS